MEQMEALDITLDDNRICPGHRDIRADLPGQIVQGWFHDEQPGHFGRWDFRAGRVADFVLGDHPARDALHAADTAEAYHSDTVDGADLRD